MKNYKQIKKIGSGSFGQVILVQNIQTKMIYALKKIHNVDDKQFIVQKQINVLSQLNHPNILKIIEYFYQKFQKGNCLCIVLQYCRAGDLFNYIKTNKNTDYPKHQKQIIYIVKQIVSGCMALNYKGIIHRDLKPQNILLNGNVIKIADFGCAKHLESKNNNNLSFNIGTPIYTAPQIFNKTNYNEKCDVWSVGVILYFMIYGTIPFYEKTLPKIKQLIQKKTKNEQNQIALPNYPEISEGLKCLLKGMLKYNQEQRLTWGEIANSQVFHKKIESIEKYIRYLGEIINIVSWILQSLFSSFIQYYNISDICKFILLTNLYLKQVAEKMKQILNKNQQMQPFFTQNLKSYQFPDNLKQFVHHIHAKISNYFQYINKKIKQIHKQPIQILINKSGRYYLWQAQKYARKLILNSFGIHKKSSYKRSAYCIILIAEYDRFLGEQHYLHLKCKKITEQIKILSDIEIEKRLELVVQRFR